MPPPDDIDPVQDRKAERERAYVAALADAVVVKVAEIDDVPGTRVQTEHLCDSPQGRAVGRRRLRLLMAFDLYTALLTGHMSSARGDHAEVRKWCRRQADAFLCEADYPPLTPMPAGCKAAVCVNGGPHTGDAVKLAEIDEAA